MYSDYFHRDCTDVSHLMLLNRKMYFAIHIILCIDEDNGIKTHFYVVSDFQFLSLAGTWFEYRPGALY